MTQGNSAAWKGIFLGVALFASILGPLAVFGGAKNIYVDDSNHGSTDGSKDHPYRTISAALKHAKGATNVFVGKGTYKENLTLPKGVKLIGGKDKGDVVVKADNEDQPAITMRDNTEVNKITISGGRHGIRVDDNAKARIVQTVVKGSRRDGIHIDKGTRDKHEQVLIDKCVLKGNRMAGVYSDRRFVIITNTDLLGNGDGLDFTAGVKGWIADTRINDNRQSGAKFVLDGASIWTKNLSIRRNGREGVEVNAYGDAGEIGLKKTAVIDNGRYGVTKLARTAAGSKTFGSFFLDNVRFEGNRSGSVSGILRAW